VIHGLLAAAVAERAQTRTGEMEAQAVGFLAVAEALSAGQGVGDAVGGHRVGAQQFRCAAVVDAARAGQLLEEAGHGEGVVAGAGEGVDADAVGLLLVGAGEVDLRWARACPGRPSALRCRPGRRRRRRARRRRAAAPMAGTDICFCAANERSRCCWLTWAISCATTAASSDSVSAARISPLLMPMLPDGPAKALMRGSSTTKKS
jgi:hypothetical protein